MQTTSLHLHVRISPGASAKSKARAGLFCFVITDVNKSAEQVLLELKDFSKKVNLPSWIAFRDRNILLRFPSNAHIKKFKRAFPMFKHTSSGFFKTLTRAEKVDKVFGGRGCALPHKSGAAANLPVGMI